MKPWVRRVLGTAAAAIALAAFVACGLWVNSIGRSGLVCDVEAAEPASDEERPCFEVDSAADAMDAGIGLHGIGGQPLPSPPGPRMAIIIDDAGTGSKTLAALMELDYPIAFSVIPGQPRSREDVERLLERGKEILVHIPMEPLGRPGDPGALSPSMDDEEIVSLLKKHLDAVPEAAGANNHMGSRATADPRLMRLVIEEIKKRGLFFVDSRTTGATVAWKTARDAGIPWAENYCFLDSVADVEKIKGQLLMAAERAIEQAGLEGPGVVAIGHPKPETLSALAEMLPEITKMGVELCPVRDLLANPAEDLEAMNNAGKPDPGSNP